MSDRVIEPLVEAVARAICASTGLVGPDEPLNTIRTTIVRGMMAPAWKMYEQEARAAIAAVEAAGWSD